MTQQELKKLNRTDLLEMLIAQSRENEELRSQIDQLRKQQSERKIMVDNAGSIAEAALQLSGIFESAQNACAQYIESIESLSTRQEQICAKMEQETAERCQQMEQETRKTCDQMLTEAKEQADAYWTEVSVKMKEFTDAHEALQVLFSNKPDMMKK